MPDPSEQTTEASAPGAAASAAPATPATPTAQATPAAQAPTAAAAEPRTEAAQSPGWRAMLPAEWREHEVLKDFSKQTDFLSAAAEWKKKASSALAIPGKEASEEDKAAFFQSLGVPASAAEYTFQAPDGYAKDEALEGLLRSAAHQAKLSKGQAAIIMRSFAELVAKGKSAGEEENARSDEENARVTREKYGQRFQASAELARRGIARTGMPKPLYDKLRDNGITAEPAFFDYAVSLGKLFEEDGFIRSGAMPAAAAPEEDEIVDYQAMRSAGF